MFRRLEIGDWIRLRPPGYAGTGSAEWGILLVIIIVLVIIIDFCVSGYSSP